MKNIPIALILFFFSCTLKNSFAQQTIRRQYDFNQFVSVNIHLLKSDTTIPHGKFVQFFHGRRWVEGNYSNGEKDGVWVRYYMGGNKMVEGQYIDGIPDGTWKRYNSKGDILAEIEYNNGVPTGIWRSFYNNKKHRKSAEFVYTEKFLTQGILYDEKERVRYNLLQSLNEEDHLQNISLYYDNKNIFTYDELKNGIQDGSSIVYHDNGSRWEEFEYKDGLIWNVIQIRTHNGQPMATGDLKDGSGTLRRYYPNGLIRSIVPYKNGLKHGEGMFYATSGFLSAQKYYHEGIRVGHWQTFNANNKITSEVFYDTTLHSIKTILHKTGGDREYETIYGDDGLAIFKEKNYNQYHEVIFESEFNERTNEGGYKVYNTNTGALTTSGNYSSQDTALQVSRFNQFGQEADSEVYRIPTEKHQRIVDYPPLRGWYSLHTNRKNWVGHNWAWINVSDEFIMSSSNTVFYAPPLPGMEFPAHRSLHPDSWISGFDYDYRPNIRLPRYPKNEYSTEKFFFESTGYLINKAKELHEKGVILVQFTVNEFGMLGNFEIISGMSHEMNQEAIQVLKKMPAWTPPYYCGMPITMFVVKSFDLTYDD